MTAPVATRTGWPEPPLPEVAARMQRALAVVDGQTPVLLLDPSVAVAALHRLRGLLDVDVLYAVKAEPHPALLDALAAAGCGFDVASLEEVRLVLAAGADPSRLSFGHPVKPRRAVAQAWSLGVRTFAVDSPQEVAKLPRGSRAVVRLTVEQEGADWPLAHKYGCGPAAALGLLEQADRAGLAPSGLTFHVGSQQRRAERFAEAVEVAAGVAWEAHRRGLPLDHVNLGGGWPARLTEADPDVAGAVAAVRASVRLLPPGLALACEPGRHLAAPAGVLVASVVGAVDRPDGRWAYLDAGVFNGLTEAEGEVVRYPLATTADGPLVPTVLAGPTCDSADVVYRRARPLLPAALGEDDLVAFGGAGAYSSSYACVGFNGFAPVRTQVWSSSTSPNA